MLIEVDVVPVFKRWKIVLKKKCVFEIKYYLASIRDLKGYINGEKHDIGQLKDNQHLNPCQLFMDSLNSYIEVGHFMSSGKEFHICAQRHPCTKRNS